MFEGLVQIWYFFNFYWFICEGWVSRSSIGCVGAYLILYVEECLYLFYEVRYTNIWCIHIYNCYLFQLNYFLKRLWPPFPLLISFSLKFTLSEIKIAISACFQGPGKIALHRWTFSLWFFVLDKSLKCSRLLSFTFWSSWSTCVFRPGSCSHLYWTLFLKSIRFYFTHCILFLLLTSVSFIICFKYSPYLIYSFHLIFDLLGFVASV